MALDDVVFLQVVLGPETIKKYSDWMQKCIADDLEHQKKNIKDPDETYLMSWEAGFPYHGAIGGGVTIEVSETSIGQVVRANYTPLDRNIDLTEYDLW